MVVLTEAKSKSRKRRRLLNIGYDRTCDCPANHLNCLTPKEWIKNQLGVWQFAYEKADLRDKELHPAVFPLQMARKVLELFTHRGEFVLDPFNGSGTTLVAARDLERNAVGFDINRKYCELSESRLAQGNLLYSAKQFVVNDDARSIATYLRSDSVQLSFTSPPYANLLNRSRLNKSRRGDERKNGQYKKVEQYSQDPNDLGTLAIEPYKEAMRGIYTEILKVTKPNGHAVINIADMWWEGQRVPLHTAIIEALREAGFVFKNTIIWDRTNIVNRVGIFGWPSNYITMGTTFEYILHFYKPPTTHA